MPLIPTILDIAKHRQEKKRRERWDPLLEKEQKLMNLAKQLEIGKERQLAKMWEPGGPRTQQPISAPIAGAPTFSYKVPEGMLHKYKRLETEYMRSPEQEQELELTGERRKKELGEEFRDYEDTVNVYGIEIPLFKRDPATGEYIRRTTEELEQIARTELESELQRQLKAIRLGLSDRDKGAEEGVFDESGNFNTRYFYEAARELYPGFSFFDLIDRGEIDKARDTILKATISALGNEITPADYPRIEAALDEWMNYLFEAHKADPGATLGTMAENIARTKERGVSPRGFSRAEILEGARERYGSAFQKIKEAFNRGDKKAPELITPGPTSEGYADERTKKENKLKGLGKKVLEKLKFWD